MVESYVLEMALEMIEPVSEIALGKGMKAFFSEECRAGNNCANEARKLRRSGDEKGAQKKFTEAIKHYEKVRYEAAKIEDEDLFDWVVSLFIKPWPIYVAQIINANGDLIATTRSSTLNTMDKCISSLEKEKSISK